MTDNILVGVAWPFPNGSLHLGQIVGAYLPADIFARYQRLAGNRVIMVSGSDQNGTPIVMLAEARGVTPQEIVSLYHNEYLDCWQRLGISWDCYTSTGTQNHIETAQEIFTKLFEKGDLYLETMEPDILRRRGPFFARPIRRRHLPVLRLRWSPRRPVRQLRPLPRPDRSDQPALPPRWLDARATSDGALLPSPQRLQRPGQAMAFDRQGALAP